MPTVLLIEDDEESRKVVAELFAREDWTVFQAEDGEVGIELALKHRPELILCDLLMPKSNGFQVCRTIREQLQPTKIIVASGRDYGVDRTSALEAGADEYLVKPITWENLSRVVERLLAATPAKAAPSEIPETGPAGHAARVKFWGVRGSIPVPGPSTIRYGGNTSCIELRAEGEIIILDAGSGIRELGLALVQEFAGRPMRLTLLISHTHWDHIQGLPFFAPAYDPKNELRVLGYEGARAGLGAILAGQMETPFFPVSLRQMPGNIAIEELKEMRFQIGEVEVRSKFLNHPGICVGYRFITPNGSIAFMPDNEPYEDLKVQLAARQNGNPEEAREFAAGERAKLVEFLAGTDILIIDAQYTEAEYGQHIGWGHGSTETAVALALEAGVRQLVLFHHDPNHDDAMIDRMTEHARALVAAHGGALEVEAAREGAEAWLGARV